MCIFRRGFVTFSVVGLTSLFLFVGQLQAAITPIFLDEVIGEWSSLTGDILGTFEGIGTNEVRWGIPAGEQKSGLRFDGSAPPSNQIIFDDPFSLGTFTHFNFPTVGNLFSTSSDLSADLSISLKFRDGIFSTTVPRVLNFGIKETRNTFFLSSCPSFQQSSTPCDDRVSLPNSFLSSNFTLNEQEFALEPLGFQSNNQTASELITQENGVTTASLLAKITHITPPPPPPDDEEPPPPPPPIQDISAQTVSNFVTGKKLKKEIFGIPIYGNVSWNSGYDIAFDNQTLELTLNIQLTGDDPGDALRQQWEDGIEGIWSGGYDILDGSHIYPIDLDVNWVTTNPHHMVIVHSGSASSKEDRANMTNWYTENPFGPSETWTKPTPFGEYQDEVAAHEAGHMLGLYDEYLGGVLDPETLFTSDNDPDVLESLMADLGPTRPWHYTHILRWLEDSSSRDLSLARSPLPFYFLDPPISEFGEGEWGSTSSPVVPEPSTLILVGIGLVGLISNKKSNKKCAPRS